MATDRCMDGAGDRVKRVCRYREVQIGRYGWTAGYMRWYKGKYCSGYPCVGWKIEIE